MIRNNPEVVNLIDLIKKGELSKAQKLCQRLLKKHKADQVLQNSLGIIYRKKERYTLAEHWARSALKTNNRFWAAHNNLARIFHDSGQVERAIKKYRWILEQHPSYHEGRLNLAVALKSVGNYEESLSEYQNLVIKKNTHISRFHLGLTLLSMGRYGEGWSNYEYRWKVSPLVNAVWPIKGMDIWNGEKDKEVVLWREQGIGDDILFLGLTPEARDRSKRLSVYVDPRLVVLCRRSIEGVEFFPYDSVIEDVMECHLPMGSLPRLFRQTEDDFKKTKKGYLKADPERVSAIRTELGLDGKKVIGISWKSIKSLNTLKKSLTLLEFGKIFEGLDVTLVNLQYGDVDQEIREFEEEIGIKIVQCDSVDNREDLDGLAALIEACDLVVSTSNVTIHLAGALGKDTWVLLPYVTNFWWLRDREDSIWYPSLKIFRQKKFQDWDSIPGSFRSTLIKKFGVADEYIS